jgi:hypothetical protein
MNKTLITSIIACLSVLVISNAPAGNTPNSARTLTTGIGSGTTHGRVPTTLPYNTHATKRNSKASISSDNFDNRYTHRLSTPAISSSSTSSSSRRPTTIPATIPSQAAGHVPTSIGGNPGTPGSGSAGFSTPPSSIPATISSQAADRVPTSIGSATGTSTHGNAGFSTPPTSIPATLPSQATGHAPTSIGGRP